VDSPGSARTLGRQRLLEKLQRELGPVVLAALTDPAVLEVVCNPDGRLWTDEFGSGMRDTGTTMSTSQAESMLGTLAVIFDTVINADHPILEAELPLDGSRITAAVPPVAARPTFAIRKRASRVFTLEDYVESNSLSCRHAEILRSSVANRKNILIVGSAGSGKTTLANALLREIGAQAGSAERIVILEDTVELQCSLPNRVELRTTDAVDLQRLLRTTMRLRPDRIVIGEVRGAEALALLKAWNTGHPGGIATVHANDCLGSLNRLDQLVQEVSVLPQRRLIADAIQIIICVERTRSSWRIKELAEVKGLDAATGFLIDTL
jgi:type IV secretion system protein TrbB